MSKYKVHIVQQNGFEINAPVKSPQIVNGNGIAEDHLDSNNNSHQEEIQEVPAVEVIEDPYCNAQNPVVISFQDITSAAFKIKSGIEYTPCSVSILHFQHLLRMGNNNNCSAITEITFLGTNRNGYLSEKGVSTVHWKFQRAWSTLRAPHAVR